MRVKSKFDSEAKCYEHKQVPKLNELKNFKSCPLLNDKNCKELIKGTHAE